MLSRIFFVFHTKNELLKKNLKTRIMYFVCVQLFTAVELVVLKLYVPCYNMYMLRKSMSERKMRFFGHIVRKNGMEKRLMQ